MACDAPLRVKNWRLYHLLNFKPPVSTRQVKHAARKATLRTQYYQAYQTLSVLSRKIFYDVGGESAYGFISSGTWGPLLPNLGIRAFVVLYVVVMLMEVILLIVFFVLLGLRTDDSSLMPWSHVAIPVEICCCVMVLVTFIALVVCWGSHAPEKKPFASIDRLSPVCNFVTAVGYTVTAFLIGEAVKSKNPASKAEKFMSYMIPLIIADSMYYIGSFTWRWPSVVKRLMKIDGNKPSGFVYNGIFLMGFAQWFCAVAQWVLIGLKIHGTLDANWYLALLPFAARAILRIVEATMRALMKHTMQVRGVLGVLFDILGSFFSNGILVISLYFVAVRIERGRDTVRMSVALVPVYLTLLYILIGLVLTAVYVLRQVRQFEAEEVRLNHLYTPPKGENGGSFLSSDDRGYDALDSCSSFPTHLENKDPLADFHSTNDSNRETSMPHHPTALVESSHDPFGALDEVEKDTRAKEAAEEEEESGTSDTSQPEDTDESSYEESESDDFSDKTDAPRSRGKREADTSSIETYSASQSRASQNHTSDDSSYEYVEEVEYELSTEDLTPQSREHEHEPERAGTKTPLSHRKTSPPEM